MHDILVSKLTTIGSNNGFSSGWRQAIIWTSAGILLSGPLGTNLGEIVIEIHAFSLKKMSSANRWQCCLGLNVSTVIIYIESKCPDMFYPLSYHSRVSYHHKKWIFGLEYEKSMLLCFIYITAHNEICVVLRKLCLHCKSGIVIHSISDTFV